MIEAKTPAPLARYLREFFLLESAGGVVMIAAALFALICANSSFYHHYNEFNEIAIGLSIGPLSIFKTVEVWIKDVLMVLFFLLIGLELKREMKEGFLSQPSQIALPLFAAIAGMALPALIYTLFNHSHPENMSGWAIPTATDIAFAISILALVAPQIPRGAKIFLLAVAIFDDLGAILIIACFYSSHLNLLPLGGAVLAVLGLFIANRLNVRLLTPYILLGVVLWYFLDKSGVHTTIAGVIVGLLIPMQPKEDLNRGPLPRAIHNLHPWVSFLIVPLFAFSSAGVRLVGTRYDDFLAPLPLGIALALFLGKQFGIFIISWATIRSGLVRKPNGVSWMHFYGIATLAGIGFTMSLFIGYLAFPSDMQSQVKIGVIGGSLLSVLWGTIILKIAHAKEAPAAF